MIPGFDSLIFIDGAILADGKVAFAAFPHQPGRPREASGTRILWFEGGSWFDSGHLHLAAVGIAPLTGSPQAIVVLGRDGEVAEVNTVRGARESLPGVIGPMRGIRNVAGEILAYGMNRQIFRRRSAGTWARWDTGIPQPPDDSSLPISARIRLGIDNMGGINAVESDASGRLCAVGFRGEIYEREMNVWQAVDSPTNVILEDIRADPTRGLYVCGSNGTILHSPVPHEWELVGHDAPSANFTSLSPFRGNLYLADGHCLRVLVDDTCEVQSMGLVGAVPPSSRLFATQDILLSVAGREIYWTRDGQVWETILQ
jgi:hypothetical protein